ncbi:hypothetical protein SASPL_145504 [Salvia splendens]|uniref:Zinc finger, CCHC-type n=1 Tax=Salvia splendens TaxID=180675 RepID=A0A8X8WH54_SALSN|nr:hypothetical protein SASPL_145504 [Salvia splendens]
MALGVRGSTRLNHLSDESGCVFSFPTLLHHRPLLRGGDWFSVTRKSEAVAVPHEKHIDNAPDAQCVMLSSMSLELQRQHEHMFPYEMLKHLESLYASQAQTMEYEILLDLFKCKLHDGSKVSEHVLKMIGLIKRLASIGTVLPANVSTNLILQSLPSSFENFIVNFNMNNTKVGLSELHNMLKTYEFSTAKT